MGMSRRYRVLLTTLALAMLMVFAFGASVALAASPPAWSANLSVTAPYAVAVDSGGNVYGLDVVSNHVLKYDSSGVYQTSFPLPLLSTALGLCVDSSGNMYITDIVSNSVLKLDASGAYQSSFGSFNQPWGIAVDSWDNFYVADTNNNQIQVFDWFGDLQFSFDNSGSLSSPWQLCVDSSGNIYVTEQGTNGISKFDSSGNLLGQFGTVTGSLPGQFDQSNGVAVDSSGNIYVVDTYNHRVQEFDSSFTYLTQWGTSGGGNGQFNEPNVIALGSAGKVYVGDYNNNRVEAFAPVVPPAIDSFTPASGPEGTVVTLTGSGFTGATAVTFNGIAATAYSVDSDTQITATVPTGNVTGKIVVTLASAATIQSATDFIESDYQWIDNGNGTATITKYLGTGTSVAIPGTLNGLTVTGIDGPAPEDGAFRNNAALTSVTIPSSVTWIGRLAFERCSGLTTLIVPSTVTDVGNQSFQNCTGLTTVTIEGTPSLRMYVFDGCSNLTAARFLGNEPAASMARYLFRGAAASFKVYIVPGATGFPVPPGPWIPTGNASYGSYPIAVPPVITASSYGDGTVTPAGATSVPFGSDMTYTIAANPGYGINGVWVDGVYRGPLATYTFTNVTSAHTIYASFYPKTTTPASSEWSLLLAGVAALGVALFIRKRSAGSQA